jgi:hypothetical protein
MEGFCTQCGLEIESFEGLERCPRCGTDGKPCDYANQLTVSINLHELRLLCIWAENWGTKCNGTDVVYAIANRLRKQFPEKFKDHPLTMADEFKQLKDCGYDFLTNHPAADNPETGESYRPES